MYDIDIFYFDRQYTPINQLNAKDYPPNSLIVLDPLTGLNASKSSYRIDDIQATFYEANLQLTKLKKDYENYTVKFENSVYHCFKSI